MIHLSALLIDPADKSIRELSTLSREKIDLDMIYGLIEADTFDALPFMQTEVIYIDDNGLSGLAEGEPAPFFEVPNRSPIAGKGLILGVDKEGDTISTRLPLFAAQNLVKFTTRRFLGFKPIADGATINHPLFGVTALVGSTAEFSPPLA